LIDASEAALDRSRAGIMDPGIRAGLKRAERGSRLGVVLHSEGKHRGADVEGVAAAEALSIGRDGLEVRSEAVALETERDRRFLGFAVVLGLAVVRRTRRVDEPRRLKNFEEWLRPFRRFPVDPAQKAQGPP
ncbi:MAG TPA: hypothetical protein PKA62_14915, partial [Thermoanaerobaculia bacterium]|nr:hypothetical protein [Thermoanaerobaculia bacterium]